jgi:hypothetical protein
VGKSIACLAFAVSTSAVVHGQQPFYTDDADVTARGRVHVECFDEHDWLPVSQWPHAQQNTFNMKVNYGLGRGLELDVDAPLITIVNDLSADVQRPFGIGDTNFGVKFNVREEREGSPAPAFTLALYTEVPTGEVSTGLGSGLVDVWAYAVVQKTLPRAFTLRLNGGYLFHGNTSTGLVGITTVRGHVATMGGSITRKLGEAITAGVDVTAAAAHDPALERAQLQVMFGGGYELRDGFAINGGVIAGHYTASPRFGVQIGFSWDLPD